MSFVSRPGDWAIPGWSLAGAGWKKKKAGRGLRWPSAFRSPGGAPAQYRTKFSKRFRLTGIVYQVLFNRSILPGLIWYALANQFCLVGFVKQVLWTFLLACQSPSRNAAEWGSAASADDATAWPAAGWFVTLRMLWPCDWTCLAPQISSNMLCPTGVLQQDLSNRLNVADCF